jgi:hypothetical protein
MKPALVTPLADTVGSPPFTILDAPASSVPFEATSRIGYPRSIPPENAAFYLVLRSSKDCPAFGVIS